MPYLDVWSLGMETPYRCWMAFKWFSPLWSILLPSNCRVGKRKRRIKNRFIIIIFPVCRHRSGTASKLAVTRSLLLHFTCATSARYRQDLLYWLLCYSIISELFSIPAPYWWTGVAPYQQRIRYSYRSTPLIPVVSWGSSSILVWCIMLAGWHFITVLHFFVYSIIPQRSKHQTSISFLTSLLHMCYICLLTPWALDMTQICVHMFPEPLQPPPDWIWFSFMSHVVLRWQIVRGKCSVAHAVLTFSTLSFGSGALTNIPHQFLMHSHMVVLFFFRYSAR